MATYEPAKRATAWIGYISLVDANDNRRLKSTATLAAGDVTISKDGGAFANLTTLPAVTPAASYGIKIDLSATEMTADNVLVVFHDQTDPPEWLDYAFPLATAARQIDDLAFPNTSGRGIDVSVGGEVGLDWANIGSPTTAQGLTGTTIATSQVVASVTGVVGSVAAGGIAAASFAAGAIDAAAIATDAIGANEVSAGAVTKIQAGLATPTNITAGVITTVTTLTNAPTAGDLTATMKTSVTTAATAATPVAASVAGNVGGNLNGNVVGSVASVTAFSAAAIQSIWDRLTAALTTVGSIGKLIVDNLNAPTGSVPTAIQNADALLTRDLTAVAAPSARSPMNALRKLMNRVGLSAGTLTVYAEDDATPAYSQAVTQDAAQTPIKELDTN